MASQSDAFCHLCNDTMDSGEDVQQHLLNEHQPPELAEELATLWESEEHGNPE
ncbi:hypothetical protein [Natronosalvus caseinilyticus]|uniref:hypothetical protein n=1 Tax=Natronosalvus caseinilyticus TaxID=2953747 RepID=UPI0028AC3566|nr:hypothetical protein [Natronosalvus caseinilyticus]